MQQLPQKISKQTNRIKRLTSDLGRRFPQITDQLDEILYAAIKIEKIMTEVQKNKDFLVSDRYQFRTDRYSVDYDNNDIEYNDEYCKETTERINKFMNKVTKFDRKMSILIHEASFGRVKNKSSSVQNLFQNKKLNQYQIQTPETKNMVPLATSSKKNNRYSEKHSQKSQSYRSPQLSGNQKPKKQKINNDVIKRINKKIQIKQKPLTINRQKQKQKQNKKQVNRDEQLQELDNQILEIINRIKLSGIEENRNYFQDQFQYHRDNQY